MRPTRTWKSRERKVAAYFGTERVPLSGGNSKHTRSDTLSPYLYIECKHAKRHAVWTLYDETKPKARKEAKPPVIALSRKNSPGTIFCIHSDDLPEFLRACCTIGLCPSPETQTAVEELSGMPPAPEP